MGFNSGFKGLILADITQDAIGDTTAMR